MFQDSCGFRAQTIFENQYRLSKSMVLGVKDIHKKTWDCFQRVLGRLWKPESTTLTETQPKLALGMVYSFEQALEVFNTETSLGASRMACKRLFTRLKALCSLADTFVHCLWTFKTSRSRGSHQVYVHRNITELGCENRTSSHGMEPLGHPLQGAQRWDFSVEKLMKTSRCESALVSFSSLGPEMGSLLNQDVKENWCYELARYHTFWKIWRQWRF